MQPLAERMRPKKLDEVVGQSHVIGEGKLLRSLISLKQPFSVILWGPPGSGKTTLARILANELEADFAELSAVNSVKADINKVIEKARVNQSLNNITVLFVDEIHRFNKAQQDAFLPHVESGLITLIGATTENPSFEVITPLLSRSRVVTLEPLGKKDILGILKRAINSEKIIISEDLIGLIADLSGGDARSALGILELSVNLANGEDITSEIITESAQNRLPDYDKLGENHYNLISAFIKSMRGNDADATLYYLARMIQAGEDPKFIARRMVTFASEDVGLAASAALNLTISTFQTVERVGLPECQFALFHCATVLAKCKKSRIIADSMQRAFSIAKQYPNEPVPLHLRNATTKLMSDLGYGKNYEWQAGFEHGKGFLPEKLKGVDILKD